MTTDDMHARQLRHDLRGRMNGLRLCAAALGADCTPEETIEFIDDIISLCDEIQVLVGKIEDFYDRGGGQSP